mmetsp:Transcript_2911/g.2408  ORF Transcript_2911/g.2408 Transcript_2911/m.2408 type:complete len:116 (-) Transcript_2911:7-354(-)
MSESAKKLASAASAVSAAGTAASIIVSILNVAAPAAVWSMMNQMQYLQLLILIKIFIPDDSKGMLAGNKEALFDMSFIPLKMLPYFVILTNSISFEQKNSGLMTLGFESGSSLVN